jgi:hypothetical protein
MLRWLLGFLILLVLASPASAQGIDPGWAATVGTSGGGGGGSGTCNGFTDPPGSTGCANAPPAGPYTFQDTNVFPHISGGSQIAGSGQKSGQSYATTGGCAGSPTSAVCHPPWPVAGIDYPVGPSCGNSCNFGQPGSATDPTISANLPTGCTYASFKVTCNVTGAFSLGPLDFTAAGNSTNTDITISLGASADCTLHDSIFNFDLAKTPLTGITVFAGGCSGGINFFNDSFKIHNSSTGSTGVFDNGGTTAVFFSSSQGTGATPAQMAVVTHFKYNYFQTCPGRCITPESGLLEYNYFGALAMYTTNQPGIHGDGWGSTWDDLHCSCSNVISHIEQYDTWIVPPGSQGQTTCIPCGNIQAQDSNFTATFTKGQASINVTTAATFAQIGDWVYTGTGTVQFGGGTNGNTSANSPWPAPVITSFPPGGATSTGTFGVSQRWVSQASGSAGGSFYAPATMQTQVVDHSVFITNITQASFGSPNANAFPLSRLVQGSNSQSNVTITNNYIDTCGIATGTASVPCGTPSTTNAPLLYTSLPNVKYIFGNNVVMGNGLCSNNIPAYEPCAINTTYPPQVNFSPTSDTNVSVLGVTLVPNGTPSIVQGAKTTTVGGVTTLSTSPTVGNGIIAAFTVNNGSSSPPATVGCTDNATSGTNTYTQQNTQGGATGVWSYIFTAPVTRTNAGSFAVTCTATGASSQKTVVEEAAGVNTGGSHTTDPTELYGQANFMSSVSGANNATSTPWPRKTVPDLIWGVYFGGASSMTYGTSPFTFTGGPSATQGGGVFTENAVE